MSGFAEHLRQRELARQARAATAEAERLAGVMEQAGDPVPPRLAARLEAALNLAERLWLEYSVTGAEAEEPGGNTAVSGTYDQMKDSECFAADVCVMDPDCPFVRDCREVEDDSDDD